MENDPLVYTKIPFYKHIRFQITIYFTGLVIVVIVIISFFTGLIFTRELVSQTNSFVETKTHAIINDFHQSITEIREVSNLIQKDDEILKLINGLESKHNERKLTALLNSYALQSGAIHKILFVNLDNTVVDPQYSNSDFVNQLFDELEFAEFVRSSNAEKFSSSTLLTMEEVIETDTWGKENGVNYYSKFYNEEYNRIGYLVILIETNVLFESIKIFSDEIFEEAYIQSDEGDLIYNLTMIPMDEFIQCANLDVESNTSGVLTEVNNEKIMFYQKPLGYNSGWRITGFISYESLIENVSIMRFTIYTIGFICIVGVILISYFVSRSLTNPIHKINETIALLERGHWPSPLKLSSDNELELLGDGIDRMIKNLKRQFDKIIEEEEEKKEVEFKALQLEMDLLQCQINPHFIHNTLNTFSYFALKNNDMKLRELIQSFNLLLRASMSIKDTMVTVRNELDLLDKYLEIQRSRYGDVFDYQYEVDDEVLDVKMPKLLLQPLVENALYHGIVPKGEKGAITVKLIPMGDVIQIKVEDNGVEIEKERLKNILEGKKNEQSKGFNNIGMTNINDRLKILFGDAYFLKITSEVCVGTSIVFNIPRVD